MESFLALVKNFECPLTKEVMKDPVITEAGQTYEKSSIEAWFERRLTDPMTNERLQSRSLIPNIALKKTIQDFMKAREASSKAEDGETGEWRRNGRDRPEDDERKVSSSDNLNPNALIGAAINGDPNEIRRLLSDKRHDLEHHKGNGMTALAWAASRGHVPVVEVLLKAGADPRAGHEHGWNPVLAAARAGNESVISHLLRAAPDLLSAGDRNGKTPLHWAALGGKASTVEVLLKRGADPKIQDNNGKLAEDLARNGGHSRIARLLSPADDPVRSE